MLPNITSLPSGIPEPLLGGHRAGHGRQVPDVAGRQHAAPRRRAVGGRRPRRHDRGAERAGRRRRHPGSNGVIFLPWLNGERTPVDNHRIRGGWFNLGLGHRAGRPGAGRVRRRGAQHPLDAGRRREVHQAALRRPQLRRRRRPLGAVVPDHGRRARPAHPPGGRSGAGQRARRGVQRLGRARPPARGTTSPPRSRSPRRSSPNRANAPPTTACSTRSSSSTRRTRASTPSSPSPACAEPQICSQVVGVRRRRTGQKVRERSPGPSSPFEALDNNPEGSAAALR